MQNSWPNNTYICTYRHCSGILTWAGVSCQNTIVALQTLPSMLFGLDEGIKQHLMLAIDGSNLYQVQQGVAQTRTLYGQADCTQVDRMIFHPIIASSYS